MMTQSWNEHARLSSPPKRSTAQPMTLPAGAVSKSAAREASSSRSTLVSVPAPMVHAPRPSVSCLCAACGDRRRRLAAGHMTCPASRPLLYMTNQIGFYPFPDRFDRFQTATITGASRNDIGAAHMTTTIDAQAGAMGRPNGSPSPDHLDLLEAHAVFVMREVAAEY